MYAQDRKARAQEVFLPFRRLCGRRSVETVVLEGDSVAEALVRYTVESGVRNLVLGSASLSWLRGSYYRCTNSKCTVKKRLKQYPDDPSVVITTYECQHCHHTASFQRGVGGGAAAHIHSAA